MAKKGKIYAFKADDTLSKHIEVDTAKKRLPNPSYTLRRALRKNYKLSEKGGKL